MLPNGRSPFVLTVLSFFGFLFLFRKKKLGVAGAIPIAAIKLPVADFRRQLSQGGVQVVPLLTDAKAGVIAITAWTMTAARQICGIVHAAPAGAASASQSARLPQAIPPPLRGGE